MKRRVNPLEFGRIPVEFYKSDKVIRKDRMSPAERPAPMVLLVYRQVFPDGYLVTCPIESQNNKFKHMRLSSFNLDMYKVHFKFRQVKDAGEAQEYLKAYCKHFNLSEANFVVYARGKELSHFSLRRDGVDECPCKEAFSL